MGRRHYSSQELKVQTINGTSVKISVDADGEFYALVAGTIYRADTLAGLVSQLRTATRKQKIKVAVPATILGRQWNDRPYQRGGWISGYGVQHVTLEGLDAHGEPKIRDDKTGAMLARHDVQRVELVRRLTDEEAKEYTRLTKAKHEAESAFDTFEKKVAFPLSVERVLRDALSAKIDTPEEPEDEPADPRVAGAQRP